jgi:hypothetical protein
VTAPASAPTRRLGDPLAEALRLIDLARDKHLILRLMGGLAIHARVPTWTARIDREGRDIDLATRSKDRWKLRDLLTAEGYAPDKSYNAIHGYKQLYFSDPVSGRPVDVLIERMEMCHVVEFGDRLGLDSPTLPLADLLLTKLQIVKINRKDVLDALVLLGEFPLGSGDDATINVPLIARTAGSDWGWWRTIRQNLDRFDGFVLEALDSGELDVGRPLRHDLTEQIATLRNAIDAAPKSIKWRLRDQVGDRVQWYREPEESTHS